MLDFGDKVRPKRGIRKKRIGRVDGFNQNRGVLVRFAVNDFGYYKAENLEVVSSGKKAGQNGKGTA